MPITALPTPPSRSDSPQDFSDRADALLGALPGFVTEANALQSGVNAKEASTSSYATIATDKAAEAQGYATTATTKASEAAASAIAAAAAANNAEIAFDSFDDKYLGSKAADPATDNDGNALLTGALYWNTSVGAVRVWNGSAWLSMAADASIVTFQQSGTGAIVTTVQSKLREITSAADYSTIQQAINAAGANGTLIIPQSYTGTDSYTNTNEISIIDLRKKPNSPGNSVGGIGIYSVLETNGDNIFPMGQDLVLRAKGSADTYIEHLNIRCTTTANLIVGVNDVPISAVTVGNRTRGSVQTGDAYLFSEAGALMVGRETDNEEQINAPNFQIINGTTLRITCTKPHSGTTDIEMIGSTLMTGWDLYIGSGLTKPEQNTTWDAPLRLKDIGGRYIAKIPGNIDNAMPHGGWQWGCMQTGLFGADRHLYYQHALPTSKVIWRNNSGSDVVTLDNDGRLAVSAGIGGGTESVKLEGALGELQIGGRINSAITSPVDAVISWASNSAPLNPSATAGSLVLAASNIVNSEVVIAAENTVAIRAGKNKIGFNGSAPVAKPVITGSRGGNAALASLLAALASMGLVTDSTTP